MQNTLTIHENKSDTLLNTVRRGINNSTLNNLPVLIKMNDGVSITVKPYQDSQEVIKQITALRLVKQVQGLSA